MAKKQRNEERQEEGGTTYRPAGKSKLEDDGTIGQDIDIEIEPGKVVLRRFHGSVELDPMRLGRDAGRIADEVISHLEGLVGSEVEITLEISVETQDDIPENVVRIVSENCNTLKFKTHGFEEG